MSSNPKVIIYSEAIVLVEGNYFYIKAEDINGKLQDIVGPLEDMQLVCALRIVCKKLVDGWAYLEDVRSSTKTFQCGT